MKNISIFKPEHLSGDYKYDIFDEVGTNAYGTDFCISFEPVGAIKGKYAEGQIPVKYWTDWHDYSVDVETSLSSWAHHSYVTEKGAFREVIYSDHEDIEKESKTAAGLRIAVPLSELPLDNIKTIDVFETVEYGEYPQTEASPEIHAELDRLRSEQKLVRTGKKYTVGMYKKQTSTAEEILYNNKKYVYCNDKYYEVNPITWVVSKKDNIAFSREVLMSNIPVNRIEEFLSTSMGREILPLQEYLDYKNDELSSKVELERKVNTNVRRQREAFLSKINEAGIRILTTRDLLLLDRIPSSEKEHSDFAALLGLGISDYKRTSGSWIDSGDNEVETVLSSDGQTLFDEQQSMAKNAGVRPVLVLKGLDNIKIENGSFEYGEYPQTLVKDVTIISQLDQAYAENKLNKTGKVYTINTAENSDSYAKSSDSNFSPDYLDEFEYNGKKYVRVVSNENGRVKTSDGTKHRENYVYYVEVEPIKWNVIKDGELAIADRSLFTNVNLNHIQSYLNTYFANEMLANSTKNLSQENLKEIRLTPYRFNVTFETPEEPKNINHLYEDIEKKKEAQKLFFIKEQTNSILRYYKDMLLSDYNEKKAKEIFDQNSKEVVKLLLKDALEGNHWWLDNVNYDKVMEKQLNLPIRVISKNRIKTFSGLLKKKDANLTKDQKDTIKKLR